jgi:magnesium transporter
VSDEKQPAIASPTPPDITTLVDFVLRSGPLEAHERIEHSPDDVVVEVLARVNPAIAVLVLFEFEDARREQLLAATPPEVRDQWLRNHAYPEDSIGRLMDPPTAVFRPETTVGETIDRLAKVVKRSLVTYGWVTDSDGRLTGVLVFRELLFADRSQRLADIMVPNPFALQAGQPATDAMKEAVKRHFPVYPVVDAEHRLIGVVRGQTLFEQQAFELSAQAGSMVGVEKEERLNTPFLRSLRFRHPWLQLNLLTAFTAAAVVGTFEDTIDQLVVLAVFLPVLAGQSGNTGCQALAVILRALTLGELQRGQALPAVMKEACLGLSNGLLVGITAGAAMWWYASGEPGAPALTLAVVVMLAMVGSCTISGISGAVVPLVLRRLGADPATASSIFLTTATDVASMGMFLGLATLLVL